MKTLLFGAALSALGLLANSAPAQAQQYSGAGVIGLYDGCEADGFDDGDGNTLLARMRYARVVNGVPLPNRISIFLGRYAYHFELPETYSFGVPVQATAAWAIGSIARYSNSPATTPIVTLFPTPSGTTVAPTEIMLNGTIDNFSMTQGCSAQFSIVARG